MDTTRILHVYEDGVQHNADRRPLLNFHKCECYTDCFRGKEFTDLQDYRDTIQDFAQEGETCEAGSLNEGTRKRTYGL